MKNNCSIETKIEFLYRLVCEYDNTKKPIDNITDILENIEEKKRINIKLSTALCWLYQNNFNKIINKSKKIKKYKSTVKKYRNFKEQVNYLDNNRRNKNGEIKEGNFINVYNTYNIEQSHAYNNYSIETKIEFLYKFIHEYDSKKIQLKNITDILENIQEKKGINIKLSTARSWLLESSYSNFNTIIDLAKQSEEYNSTDEEYNDFKEQVNQLNWIMKKFKHNNENFIKIIKNLNNSLKEIQKYDDNQIQENLHFIINTIKLLPDKKIQKNLNLIIKVIKLLPDKKIQENLDFIKNVTYILCKHLSDNRGRSDFKYYKFIIDISNKTDQNEIKNIFYENLNEDEIKKQLYLYDNIYEAKFNLVEEIYSMNKDLNNCKYHQNNIIDSCESILFTEPDKKNIFNRFNFILDSIDIINDKNIKNDILNRLKNKIQPNANEIYNKMLDIVQYIRTINKNININKNNNEQQQYLQEIKNNIQNIFIIINGFDDEEYKEYKNKQRNNTILFIQDIIKNTQNNNIKEDLEQFTDNLQNINNQQQNQAVRQKNFTKVNNPKKPTTNIQQQIQEQQQTQEQNNIIQQKQKQRQQNNYWYKKILEEKKYKKEAQKYIPALNELLRQL